MSEDTLTPEAVLEKAIRMNYDPDRYPKDDPRYKTPEEFIAFGEQLAPVLKENNKRLLEKNATLEAEIAAIRAEVTKFAAVHAETVKKAYAQALADLKAQKKEALENQDFDAVVDLDEKIANTKLAATEVPVVKQPEQSVIPTDVQETYNEWLKKNQWNDEKSPEYNEDMEAYARATGELLARKGTPTKGRDFEVFLNMVAKKVQERFPEKFENQRRTNDSKVEGSGSSDAKPVGKHTYSHLPQEAKEACDLLVKTIPGYSREKYCQNYKW